MIDFCKAIKPKQIARTTRSSRRITKTIKCANCKEGPEMFPQKGEGYWGYDQWGEVFTYTADDSEGRLEVYKTREEAKKAVEIQWAKQRVAHKIAVLNDGWKPDWTDQESKYFIKCHMGRGKSVLMIDSYVHTKKQPD